MRIEAGLLLRAGLVLSAVMVAGMAASRARRLVRYAVAGESMAPALLPGDFLIVDTAAYRLRAPRVGEVVLTADPRDPSRTLLKRVAEVTPDARLVLLGDNSAASTDSRTFGAVRQGAIVGRAVFRYWPPSRIGWVAASFASTSASVGNASGGGSAGSK